MLSEDKTFHQIIARVKKLFPDRYVEVGKIYRHDEDSLSFLYILFIEGELDTTANNFLDLCDKASDFLAEHDTIFQRRKFIHDRNWSELFKLDSKSNNKKGDGNGKPNISDDSDL